MDGEWLRKNRFLSIERKDSMRKTSSSFKKPYVILNCLTRFQIFRSSWITGNTERQKLQHRQKLTAVSIWYAQLISSPRDGPRVCASLATATLPSLPVRLTPEAQGPSKPSRLWASRGLMPALSIPAISLQLYSLWPLCQTDKKCQFLSWHWDLGGRNRCHRHFQYMQERSAMGKWLWAVWISQTQLKGPLYPTEKSPRSEGNEYGRKCNPKYLLALFILLMSSEAGEKRN